MVRRRSWRNGRGLCLAVSLFGVLVGLGAAPAGAAAPASRGALLTYDYDNARSGNDPVGGTIANLSSGTAWQRNLDGAVYAEPLLYGGRAYVATEGDTVYALNARNGRVAWSVHVGTSVPQSVVNAAPGAGCGDIDPEGITGTPAIDPGNNELFVVGEVALAPHSGWRSIRHELFAISLTRHRVLWKRVVDPPGGNSPAHYYIPAEQQRGAVTIANGRVYTVFGGLYGDCGQYHGFVVGLPESGSGALLSYQVPSAREGAIWETNGAMVATNGNLFVATGNTSSSNSAQYDEGDSVIELTPSLQRLADWAPANWVRLNANDWDLGSAGPIAIPGTKELFVAGKPVGNGNVGYLVDEQHLGGVGGPAYAGALCSGGGAFGADAVDVLGAGASRRVLVFVPCGSGTTAAEITGASFHVAWRQASGDANGPPIVAGGMVFALDWSGGTLYGMNPANGRVRVERSTGALEHFATPAVGDGMLLVGTTRGVEAFRTIA